MTEQDAKNGIIELMKWMQVQLLKPCAKLDPIIAFVLYELDRIQREVAT
jgi:hypothetical protein